MKLSVRSIAILLGIAAIAITGFLWASRTFQDSTHIPKLSGGASRSLKYHKMVQETFNFNVPDRVVLILDNYAGNVQITQGLSGRITVDAQTIARGASQEQAEENLRRFHIQTNQTAETVAIKVEINTAGSGDWGGSVNFVISVPENTTIQVNSRYGDLSITNIWAEANVYTGFGRIDISNLQGGPLSATTRSGQINARNIQVDAQPVRFSSDFGEITIDLIKAVSLSAQTKNGAVRLTGVDVAGQLSLSSEFGDLSLQDVAANSLDIKAKNGNISFEGGLMAGPNTLRSDFGTVRLRLPDDIALAVDLHTIMGMIYSELAVMPNYPSSDKHWIGRINNGDIPLQVSTRIGDIVLEIHR